MSRITRVFIATFTVLLTLTANARAQDPESCALVRLGTVGWLDAGSAVSIASALLEGLGYQTTQQRLDAPTILTSLKNEDLDVFFEVMVPTMGAMLKPYIVENSVELVRMNLEGTKYSLAVNTPAGELGIKSFDEIASHAGELKHRIHGVEPGADGNLLIQSMIEENRFGLAGFELVESSEAGLMASIAEANREGDAMVFLAFEPHPMNVRFELTWLTGGDGVFGADFGGADVYTGTRGSLPADCPNIAKLLSNLEFSLPMINEVMTAILELNARPLVAAIAWMRQHPDVLESWLSDVTTLDGEPGVPAVRRFMGLTE